MVVACVVRECMNWIGEHQQLSLCLYECNIQNEGKIRILGDTFVLLVSKHFFKKRGEISKSHDIFKTSK
jgi:hypothetical protein